MSDRPSSAPLSTISSINDLEISDADDKKPNQVENNKPIEVHIPRLKKNTEVVPALKKKLRSSLSSLSSDFTELSQIRESK